MISMRIFCYTAVRKNDKTFPQTSTEAAEICRHSMDMNERKYLQISQYGEVSNVRKTYKLLYRYPASDILHKKHSYGCVCSPRVVRPPAPHTMFNF